MELFSRTFSYFPVFLPARFRYSAQFSIASDPVIPKSYANVRGVVPRPPPHSPPPRVPDQYPPSRAPTAWPQPRYYGSSTNLKHAFHASFPPSLITFTYPFGRRGIERLKVKFYANVNGCRIYFASGNVHWKLILNGKEMEKKKKVVKFLTR